MKNDKYLGRDPFGAPRYDSRYIVVDTSYNIPLIVRQFVSMDEAERWILAWGCDETIHEIYAVNEEGTTNLLLGVDDMGYVVSKGATLFDLSNNPANVIPVRFIRSVRLRRILESV